MGQRLQAVCNPATEATNATYRPLMSTIDLQEEKGRIRRLRGTL